MPCPITVTKFIGTVSLGLLTGVSYSTAAIAIPTLRALPTASHAGRALKDVKRRSRKHAFRLSSITSSCLFFAWFVASRRKKHPYLIWVSLTSAISSWGVDFWYNRELGLGGWLRSVVEDIDFPSLTLKKTPSGASSPSSKKDDDLVVVEEDFNGETVEHDMAREQSHQIVRSWLAGAALSMAIVGLWGDGA
ncbi:hypothetical protein TMatcc_002656 [Talaromyces marneffei ATCC 18224]|uniref:Uncharacterized protein n=1 Tax=Talaromyces marneffei (strain ATCC 18224 / CBS 334.59 / QM 7333) TaxID=441960 RepID=B6Q2B6_TALMQ|nr:uncharacterized protein EYB26_002242 [Talaromyces marneffei]EEA28987.1 conserved hypothetical protein [Talaromyces marneffei ATCC 18224]KAE8555416.1 hypothetical protein EYB25_000111 [Talaromyces marneffei]QGA14586.1 hypothetical protein EYB26_002242 [Talaromyces marneffei]